ncbi:MAG: hypothetical protein Ct9H90mP15_07170 [Candidatus Neomarinimicrobiota bacterium]|nr:MAG: hypothetical protein Ct9H90mP15_07170 [Candidatus Neomarinimicrobiota bacterium]
MEKRIEEAQAEVKEAKAVMKNNEVWNINDKGPVFGFNIDDNGNPRPLLRIKVKLDKFLKVFLDTMEILVVLK